MAKKPIKKSRKSRFEMLEDRRLLTVFSAADPFTQQGPTADVPYAGPGRATTAGYPAQSDSGEAAFGDNYWAQNGPVPTGSNSSGFNDGNGTPVVESHSVGSDPIANFYNYSGSLSSFGNWQVGYYTSGTSSEAALAAHPSAPTQAYTQGVGTAGFNLFVNPGTFVPFTTQWALDGIKDGYPGLAGMDADFSSTLLEQTAEFYTYGNSGDNGDGGNEAVADPFIGLINLPTGSLDIAASAGPTASRFTSPTGGVYNISATFTDPYFDPLDGYGGANSSSIYGAMDAHGDDGWAWSDGQPDYLVFAVPAGATTIGQTTMVASGLAADIQSGTGGDNIGTNPGQFYTNNSFLAEPTQLNGTNADYDVPTYWASSVPTIPTYGGAPSTVANGGLSIAAGSGHGFGGTWSLTNLGNLNDVGSDPLNYNVDTRDITTQFDMTWTVNTSVTLSAGESLDFAANPEYDAGYGYTADDSGIDTAPTYLSANVTPVPVLTSSNPTNTYSGTPVVVDNTLGASVEDVQLTGATATINSPQTGDVLNFTSEFGITNSTPGTSVVTLTGAATPADYQAALRSITFSTTSGVSTPRTISFVAEDDSALSNTETDTLDIATSVAPPVVTTPNSPVNSFTLGQSPQQIDSGITVSSADADITGATDTITNAQTGDVLHYTSMFGITNTTPGTSAVTLTGSATPSQYAAALASVTFSTTSTVKTTRVIDVVADDSAASPTTSNIGTDDIHVVISAPVLTGGHSGITYTDGQSAELLDAGITVSSADTDLTGATVTISSAKSGDILNFTNQSGITNSTPGTSVVTLSGSATPAQYQTALDSITFSNATNTTPAVRSVAIVVSDSNATTTNSSTVTESITGVAPINITGAYVRGSTWSSTYLSWLSTHAPGASSTLGYELQAGSAQLTTLPWAGLNTISVVFSSAPTTIDITSLKLVGGTGTGSVAAPSVSSFSITGDVATWVLSGALGNNKFAIGVGSTGNSFGTAVTDARGAGLSGTWTTSTTLWTTNSNGIAGSGTGLAGGTFDFFFDVLPGDSNQNATDNSSDSALVKSELNLRTTSAGYNYLVDYNGTGTINSADTAVDDSRLNVRNSTLTAPTAPSAGSTGVVSLGTSLALGAIETTGSPTTTTTAPLANFVSTPSPTTSSSSSTTTSTSGSGSGSTSTTTSGHRGHGNHFAATDEAVGEFELTDLWV